MAVDKAWVEAALERAYDMRAELVESSLDLLDDFDLIVAGAQAFVYADRKESNEDQS